MAVEVDMAQRFWLQTAAMVYDVTRKFAHDARISS